MPPKYGAKLRFMDLQTIPPEQYTPEKGKYVAECFAAGDSLKDICECSEGWLPAMLYVRRWRSMYPAFDSLMLEAAACRAENMAEELIEISDDYTRQSSHNRNRMKARELLAGWLAPAAYGNKDTVKDADHGEQAPVYALTDEQLLMIAAGKLAPAIDGECERLQPEGGHPPRDPARGIEYEVSGPKKPQTTSGEPSVTTVTSGKIPGMEVGSEKFPDIFFEDDLLPPEVKNFEEPGDADRGRRSFIGME